MKSKHIISAVILAVSTVQAATAEHKLPAPMPEFKTPEQLAIWRKEMTEKAKAADALSAKQAKSALPIEKSVFFTGKPYLQETGSYAFKFRQYDPELNRWTTSDPSGFPDGANNFVYGTNPLNGLDSVGRAWSNWDFVYHYYFGGGTSVTLAQIGLLSSVKAASNVYARGGASRFRIQIQSKAQDLADEHGGYTGSLTDAFDNSYDFRSVIYSLGSATLKGSFAGSMTSIDNQNGQGGNFTYNEDGALAGDMTAIKFQDSFTDPLGVIQAITGSSNPLGAPSWWESVANIGGTAFGIAGEWTENYNGTGTYE